MDSGADKLCCRDFQVIDECDDWVVVNKPPHLQVHPSKPDGSFTLWHGLRELLAFEMVNGGQVSIINRLDRETSGLVLICKNTESARRFSRLMAARKIHKTYQALVWGWPTWESLDIDEPIGRRGEFEASPIYLKQMIHPRGASAHTCVKVEKRFRRTTSNGEQFSLVRVYPKTGRMHQIRVHLAHVGHPVVGDKIYGPDERCYLEFIQTGWTPELAQKLLLPRHALHSAELSVAEESLGWTAPLASDMTEFLAEPGAWAVIGG